MNHTARCAELEAEIGQLRLERDQWEQTWESAARTSNFNAQHYTEARQRCEHLEIEAKLWRSHCEAAHLRIAELEREKDELHREKLDWEEAFQSIMEAFEQALNGDTMYSDDPAELVTRLYNQKADWKGHCEAAVTYAEAHDVGLFSAVTIEQQNALAGYIQAVEALAAHSEPAQKEKS